MVDDIPELARYIKKMGFAPFYVLQMWNEHQQTALQKPSSYCTPRFIATVPAEYNPILETKSISQNFLSQHIK